MRLKSPSRLKSSRQFSRSDGRAIARPGAIVPTSNHRVRELANFRF